MNNLPKYYEKNIIYCCACKRQHKWLYNTNLKTAEPHYIKIGLLSKFLFDKCFRNVSYEVCNYR